ncbi:hypothetical protein BD311DRAFT_535461 [Dichomitus squalens]|uniref:Uncharacterized protein n=1 Tax=Dichomitus squalens TaxID=114155 RepID=A0A4Q9MDX6_9APHY|nr:hypothetical protein BD311DRAFT_535461 [Dichomitus squalens]
MRQESSKCIDNDGGCAERKERRASEAGEDNGATTGPVLEGKDYQKAQERKAKDECDDRANEINITKHVRGVGTGEDGSRASSVNVR